MTIKNIYAVILLSMIFSTNLCNAQEDKIKAFLFLSVFCEESDSYYERSAEIVKEFDSQYKNFSYECTKPITIPVSKYYRMIVGYASITRDFSVSCLLLLK